MGIRSVITKGYGCGLDFTTKRQHEGFFLDTVLYPGCDGGYMNPNFVLKLIELCTHTHTHTN